MMTLESIKGITVDTSRLCRWKKNKVGRIKEDEIILLDFIEPWSKFKLILEGE